MANEDAPATRRQRAAIVAALRADGIEVEEFCAAGDPVPTPYTVAHRFRRYGYRLMFRVLEPHWVLIAMYERVADQTTLRDPFAAMAWFIDWLRRQHIGVRYVLGRVETGPFRKGRDLGDDRLLCYYVRWGGASIVPAEQVPGMSKARQLAATLQGIRFVKVEVPQFRMPKERARLARSTGARNSKGSATR
jgi:type III secretion system regulator LcrR